MGKRVFVASPRMDLAVHFGRKNNIRPEDLVYMNTRYAFSGLRSATIYVIGGLVAQEQAISDQLEFAKCHKDCQIVEIGHDQVIAR